MNMFGMGGARARLFEETRQGEPFDVRSIDVSIPDGNAITLVVSFAVLDNQRGILRAVGQETTGDGWDNIDWTIEINGRPARNYGLQQNTRWGYVASPGPTYVFMPANSTVRLAARQNSGAAILASGRLMGATWVLEEG